MLDHEEIRMYVQKKDLSNGLWYDLNHISNYTQITKTFNFLWLWKFNYPYKQLISEKEQREKVLVIAQEHYKQPYPIRIALYHQNWYNDAPAEWYFVRTLWLNGEWKD